VTRVFNQSIKFIVPYLGSIGYAKSSRRNSNEKWDQYLNHVVAGCSR